MLRKSAPWTLDWNDRRLRMRDIFVLSRVMALVAEWDRHNGNFHTVIGVQLGNDPYTSKGTQLVERVQIADVRIPNRILNLANQNIATKAHGKSLYVYNRMVKSDPKPEAGLDGTLIVPAASAVLLTIRK